MFENPGEYKISPPPYSRDRDEDDFCIDEDCCPERIETPKFPSPTSCLPPLETEELHERIVAANRLLLDLGLSGELEIEGRRRAFEGLLGSFVRVFLDCQEEAENETPAIDMNENGTRSNARTKKKVVRRRRGKASLKKAKLTRRKANGRKKVMQKKRYTEGYVKLVGQDFVVLSSKEKEMIIRLRNVALIKARKGLKVEEEHPEFLETDPCLRRELTFNFGETVASSPELIHIFYGLTFAIYLLLLQGNRVKVRVNEKIFTGILLQVHRESLTLETDKKDCHEIPLENICFVKKI